MRTTVKRYWIDQNEDDARAAAAQRIADMKLSSSLHFLDGESKDRSSTCTKEMIEQVIFTLQLTTDDESKKQDKASFDEQFQNQLALFLWFSFYPDREYLLVLREHKNNDGGTERSRAYYPLRLLLRTLGHNSKGYDIIFLANGDIPNAFTKRFPDPKMVS